MMRSAEVAVAWRDMEDLCANVGWLRDALKSDGSAEVA